MDAPKAWRFRGHVLADGFRLDPSVLGEEEVERRLVVGWRPGSRAYWAGGAWIVRWPAPERLSTEGPLEPLVGRMPMCAVPVDDEVLEGLSGQVVVRAAGNAVLVEALETADVSGLFELPPLVGSTSLAPPETQPSSNLPPRLERAAFGVPEQGPEAEALRAGLAGGTNAGPPSPNLWSGLQAFVGQAANRLGFSGWIQDRHERQLNGLLERFGSDLEEALRQAIPLGGEAGLESASHPALSAPRRRASLRPSGQASTVSRHFDASESLFDALRAAYERAAEQLEAQGRFEQAAFVLSNLLGDTARAIDLLERHERYALAARLAAERALPDRAVRLLLLAGDVGGAIAMAHRHDCFDQAVRALPVEDARGLRAAWAAHLVGAGRLSAAVDAVWADPVLRVAAAPWLRTLATGRGVGWARALVRWHALDTQRSSEVFEEALAGSVEERAALVAALVPEAWERRLARAALQDAGLPGADAGALSRMLRQPGLIDLRVDRAAAPSSEAVGELVVPEPGTWAVRDALQSPVGRLVALGEGGVVWVGHDGEIRRTWPDPVTHLVREEEGFRAIGLHPAGEGRFRLVKIDLRTGRLLPWVRARIDHWADDIRRGRWAIVVDGALHAMDVLDDGWSWLSRSNTLSGEVRGVRCAPDGLHVVQPEGLRGFDHRYVARGFQKLAVPEVFDTWGDQVLLAHNDGLTRRRGHRTTTLPIGRLSACRVWGERSAAICEGPRLVVLGGPSGRLDVPLGGATRVHLRAQTDLFVWDDTGRAFYVTPAGRVGALIR